MKHSAVLWAFSASLGIFSSAVAASDAHEHGIADLSVALEQRTLDILLSMPADSWVGFEHLAKSQSEKQAVKSAEAKLRQAYDVIVLPKAAACVLKSAHVEHALLEEKAHKPHEHNHSEDHHEHEEHKHDGAHHDEHKHAEDHHDHAHDQDAHQHAHADVKATYQFQCMAPEQLTQMSFGGFSVFPAIEQVRFQLIHQAGQTGGTLSPTKASIALSE